MTEKTRNILFYIALSTPFVLLIIFCVFFITFNERNDDSTPYAIPVTVIYFIDGSTYVLDDERWNIHYHNGIKLRFWRNDNGKIKIETIK